MTMGKPLPSRKLSGNELIEQARIKLRKSVEENTEFNTNMDLNSLKNLRDGLPEHDIISRAQNRMAAEIAKAEATGSKEVSFRFPLVIGKKFSML